MTLSIDLNADLGELPGIAGRASDAAILDVVTSCAIACGGHAGDAAIMEATLRAAHSRNVSAGAHPSYPDRANFGRVSMKMPADELRNALCQQMRALQTIATRIGVRLAHVKPHGALYNDAAASDDIAKTIVEAVTSVFGTEAALIGPPGQATEKAALAAGLNFYAEGFMDRAYLPDGRLMPRTRPGAVLNDTPARIAQARQIVITQNVTDSDGDALPMSVQTLCLHGDSPGAAETARALKVALEKDNIRLRPAEAK